MGLALALLLLITACGKVKTPQQAKSATNAPAPGQSARAATSKSKPPAGVSEHAEPAVKPSTKPMEEVPPAGTQPIAVLQTKLGKIEIRFFPQKAPKTVKNFIYLCKTGFYNGTRFHRIIPGFMIQGGDPNTRSGPVSTWGQGGHTDKYGNEITVKAEFNDIHHARGIVSMARAANPDSASSQFFICVADAGGLDHHYTVFGKVIKGMNVVDKIVNAPRVGGVQDPEDSRPKNPVAIEKAWIEYRPVSAHKTKALTR